MTEKIEGMTMNQLAENNALLTTENIKLQQQVNALVSENAVMLKLLANISDNHVEYFSEGECGMFAGVPLDYVSEINTYVSRDVNCENPFSATDAAIREIEARGVEKFAECAWTLEHHDHANAFAAHLRAGEQGVDHA